MAAGNIKVVVRVRPFNGRELDRRAKCVVQMKDAQTILIPPPGAEDRLRASKTSKGTGVQKVFAFDRSYCSFDPADPKFAGQDSLFNDLGVPLLDNAFQGYNNCIFAYGQTGSGKSYSMMGYGKEAGVIPRICQNMFERITDIQKDKNLSCRVEVSYLEIYNERVRDLLNPSTKGNLRVREHPSTGPYVEDLAKLVVRSFQEIQNLMDEGNKARTVAATTMNETSSRSHAVFTLTVTQKRHDVETSMDTEKVAKISLVDLAGSERATSTGAIGARLKEGAEINRSLSTLGRVIAALADLSTGKKKNPSMVPYRDSVLTWLLKDSLGGNSMTAMIAAISPADINFEETLSTLRYADSAKRIKNHAVINEDPNARMIRELKEELAQLRSKLSSDATSGGIAEEQYASDVPLDKQIVSIVQPDGTIKKVSKADIADRLSQSEKLYKDLNQTWEEKLQKTEQIHKEREAALEELGISIEKGFVGLSTPKKMPHLVNLNDDPLLAECLVYNIKPGTTTVGNVEDTGATSEIRLNGSKILRDHCTFESLDGHVTLIPRDGAAVMVNGIRIDKPRRLRSGSRIILGDFHIFRFTHPQEARAERAEQSLLRHSVATSQLGSPVPRPVHERTLSRADSDIDGECSRPDSPMPHRTGRDSDWSFARREAAGAILGDDHKISHLTDEELDVLFDDLQRIRAVRKGRPESRLSGQDDDDLQSVNSYPIRDKYLSSSTIDNFSLDTAITIPGTPQDGSEGASSEDNRLELVRNAMQEQLDKQKEDFEEMLQNAESSTHDVGELRLEKERMEDALKSAKEHFQLQLREQKDFFEHQLREASKPPTPRATQGGFSELLHKEKVVAKLVIERWKQLRYVRLSEIVLQYAAILKEAQIMSEAMDKHVAFQYVAVNEGQEMCSSYDLVLSSVSGEEDQALDGTRKPCIAVRVIDYQHTVIHLWSLEKLVGRVLTMRQMYQYIDRPDYLQHFRLENPFVEACMPQYSLIGDANVPLVAVFEARVQDYTIEVTSNHTHETIGVIRLSLEPSSAMAPPSMLKFNIVMHEMVGFAEREGTDVHAQLYMPGINEEGGVTTTQMIRDFDEGPIRFESVHSMSLPTNNLHSPPLRVAIYAKVTAMHLDKLLCWDEMRETSEESREYGLPAESTRLPETEYHMQEQHDVFAKAQILELSEAGEYVPVEVEQHSNLDAGTYQLHQGLQRRVVVHLSYPSSESMKWEEATSLRIGGIKLIDPWGLVAHLSVPSADIALKLVQDSLVTENSNGAKQITVVGQWDSSLHDSLLLDRPTAVKYSVQMLVTVSVTSSRLQEPMDFSLEQKLQIRPRSWIRPQSMFKQLWKTTRIVHTTIGLFSVVLKPSSVKRAADLWRLDSNRAYVKGQEDLSHWQPRGLSLVQDFMRSQQRRQLITDVEAARVFLGNQRDLPTSMPEDVELDGRQQQLLEKCIKLWTAPQKPNLSPHAHAHNPNSNPDPQSHPPTAQTTQSSPPRPTATITSIPKNPSVLKSGYLLSPHSDSRRWLRRFAELRRPYLHIYSVPDGDEIAVLNLRNARINHQPEIQKLLRSERIRLNVFAVYAPMNTWLFAARSEVQKMEWIMAIDQSYFGSRSGSGSGEDD